ncbi:MAG: ABC transporter permease [Stackebrandtia sp.]
MTTTPSGPEIEPRAPGEPAVPTSTAVPTVMRRTGQTERYVLQAAALRRRQLRSAFLYGSHRSWRQRQALWPAALAGAIVTALIVAVIAVTGAFEKQQRINDEQQQDQQQSAPTTKP